MAAKRALGIDVLTAARQRVARVFDDFEAVYLSFSGGKDSSVLLDLVAGEAAKRGRKFGLLFIDLEGQYKLTIDYIGRMYAKYSSLIDPYWVAVPIALRNAVSMHEPKWLCWDPERRADWVRTPPPIAKTDPVEFPFYRHAMEFEEFVAEFGDWWGGGKCTACLVAIRADESLNRWRSIVSVKKQRWEGLGWTTLKTASVTNAYPIYDWRTEDVWTYAGRTGMEYNRLYDLMHKAGVPISHQRICQPYGDDQRRGLWLYHLIEPETWGRVVARVAGANSGALYAAERGNILGNHKATLPPGHTWESYAKLLLDSLPPRSREHFENKIAVFVHWYSERGYSLGIPDEADPKEEAAKKAPSWRRICKAILKNDYWAKSLSFSMTSSAETARKRYVKMMDKRRRKWNSRSHG